MPLISGRLSGTSFRTSSPKAVSASSTAEIFSVAFQRIF